MGGEDRTEPAVAARLVDEAESGPADEDRVSAVTVRVDGDDDRPAMRLRRFKERPMIADRDERLVAERDEHRVGIRTDRLEADLQRARQAAVRIRVDDRRRPPVDRGFHARRPRPGRPHSSIPAPATRRGRAGGRPARQGRKQLAATEARPAPAASRVPRLAGHLGIFPPASGQEYRGPRRSRPPPRGPLTDAQGGRHR